MGTKAVKLFVVFAVVFSVSTWAAKTVIKGHMPGAENLTVRFYTWDDYLSNREVLLATAPIDTGGHFTISLNVFEKQTISGFFRVMEFNSQEIYIPANKQYELEFSAFDYKDPNRIYIPMLSTVLLRYSFNNPDSNDVNQLIGKFNYDYSSFLLQLGGMNGESSSRSIMRPPKQKIDSFVVAMHANYKGVTNDFFKNYFTYTLANLQLNTYSMSKKRLYDDFLYKKPILYDNVAYMEFFSNYFTDFIYGVSKKIPPFDIVLNVNIKPNLSGLVDSLGKDTLLRNEQLREAVLLLNIRDWYTTGIFKQDSLLKILDIYARTTKFDIQGRIARNLRFMLTRYRAGSEVPEFSFKSLDNEIFNNDSLTKKYTYMVFFSTWSHPCESELMVMEQLQKDWQDSIRFVAVSMDREPLKLFYFLEENKFTFPVYHFGSDYLMSERLSIQSYPHCMLIGKSGEFINYIAPMPAEGAVDLFNKIAGKAIVNVPTHTVGQ